MSIFVIAEVGVNHNGSVELACELADSAKEAGADAVKYQTFLPEQIVTKAAAAARYQTENTAEENQYELLRQLALPLEAFKKIKAHCDKIGIEFLSTPFDSLSLKEIVPLVKAIKISSGDATNIPFLREAARTGRPIILSTGMCTMEEIQEAVAMVRDYQKEGVTQHSALPPLTVLHCTTDYPCPYEDVHLNAMQSIASVLRCPVGYSDHTAGIEISIAAAALGATVIEKHITKDRCLEGPDHQASIEPSELKTMIQAIRHVEAALGKTQKAISPRETEHRKVARKSIVAGRPITKGEPFSEQNLNLKRPGTGIAPRHWDTLIGKKAGQNYQEDDLIVDEFLAYEDLRNENELL